MAEQFKKAWVRAKEAAAETFSFGGREHDTATGEPKKVSLSVPTAVNNVRKSRSKIDDAEAAATGGKR